MDFIMIARRTGRSDERFQNFKIHLELAQNVRAPEEVAGVLAGAEQAGGKIVRPAARAEWGGMSGAFADPDGYVWEVAHNPGWTITEDGSIRI